MAAQPIGRTLDSSGEPIPESGIEVDPGGAVAQTLEKRAGPLMSNPVSGEWVAVLEPAESTGGEYLSAVYIIDDAGPPAHYHVGYEESFEILAGELTIEVEGTRHRVPPGDTHTVESGTVHKPRYDGEDFAAAIGTVRPAARTLQLLQTMFGLTHEGNVTDSGQPGFLQGMVLSANFADDTVFTSPPPAVVRPLATLVAPIGRMLGYQPMYSKYATEEFWDRHVEQPTF